MRSGRAPENDRPKDERENFRSASEHLEYIFPRAVAAGISPRDFYDLTIKELFTTVRFVEKKHLQESAFTAYYSALISRLRTPPQTLTHAFPELFGRTETGGVDTSDWRESKAVMMKIAQRHNEALRHKGVGN